MLGAAGQYALGALHKFIAQINMLCGGGHIVKGAQQAQAYRDISSGIVSDLLESRIEEPVEAYPGHK